MFFKCRSMWPKGLAGGNFFVARLQAQGTAHDPSQEVGFGTCRSSSHSTQGWRRTSWITWQVQVFILLRPCASVHAKVC